MSWRDYLITDTDGIRTLLVQVKRIAVLGMRPECASHKPAFYVPASLAAVGFEIVPVPVLDRDVDTILGLPVYHSLVDIPGPIDLVNVFRRSADLAAHLPDMLAARPYAVWFQSGIYDDAVAEQLAQAGIFVVQNRCLIAVYHSLGLSHTTPVT